MTLVPSLLVRKCLPKPWGGRALESVAGVALPAGEAIGETWELYDRPDDSSALRHSDRTLRDLMQQDTRELLLGPRVAPTPFGYFPLLLKLVDARERLSVQVHPDDEQAREQGDCGKTEAWVVLHAGPRARIIHGLRPGVSREAFAAVAHTAAVEGLLHAFTPRVGDAIWVPPGTVHAIGPDVVVYEIQRNSDVTYRLWDWGRPRETHVAQALQALRVGGDGAPVATPRHAGERLEMLIEDPHFRLRRLSVHEPTRFPTDGTFQILTLASGRATLGWHSGGRDAPLALRAGETALVPACTESVFLSPIGAATFLVAGPGEA